MVLHACNRHTCITLPSFRLTPQKKQSFTKNVILCHSFVYIIQILRLTIQTITIRPHGNISIYTLYIYNTIISYIKHFDNACNHAKNIIPSLSFFRNLHFYLNIFSECKLKLL